MLEFMWLTLALAVGQTELPSPPPAADRPFLIAADPLAPPTPAPLLGQAEVLGTAPAAGEPQPEAPAPITVTAPLLPAPAPKPAEAAAAAAPPAPDRWWLMRELQGTWAGYLLDGNRMTLYGWTEMSYTASSNSQVNLPVVWNDRANEFMLQQHWIRLERSVVTSGTTEPTFGFRTDWLIGTDYRLILPRGLWNSQLLNSEVDENGFPKQNLYGIDAIQHYVNAYLPTVFNGLELRFGRLFCPWGVESLEAVSTPFVSRSYAFNWSPPFTHCGLGAYLTVSPEWYVMAMLVNGNDVYFGDPSQELRFVGGVKWTQPGGGRNTVSLYTSVGRGKFNAGDPFAPATIGLMTEGAGRNNMNAFDLVYTHTFNPRLTYNLEAIFAYQTQVPGIFNAEGFGTATWASLAHYLFYTMSPRLTGIVRFETFDDFQGQRTGFEGLYTAVTGGVQFKLRKDVILRPELHYDYNGYSRPFEGKHDIVTATADLILRW